MRVSISAADVEDDNESDTLSSGQDVAVADPPRFPALARTASALRSPSSILRSPMPRFMLDGPRSPSWKPNARNAAPTPSQFGAVDQRDPYAGTYGVQRTHSFPSDLYSGARFSRFEIEEALRQRNGTTLLDWLKGKGRNPFSAASRKQQMKEKDKEKRAKAQHRESFNYDFFESRVNMQHDQEQTESAVRSLNIARWVMTFGVGWARRSSRASSSSGRLCCPRSARPRWSRWWRPRWTDPRPLARGTWPTR